MISTNAKIWYVKLYSVLLFLYGAISILKPDFIAELDPTTASIVLPVGIFVNILILTFCVLLYKFSIWGKYGMTISILLTYIPLSEITIANSIIWIVLDGILIYLIWVDKQVSKLFKL